jgi:hypothetical protein
MELSDAPPPTDNVEGIGKVHHEIAEAIGPDCGAQANEGTLCAVELRGEEAPTLAISSFPLQTAAQWPRAKGAVSV